MKPAFPAMDSPQYLTAAAPHVDALLEATGQPERDRTLVAAALALGTAQAAGLWRLFPDPGGGDISWRTVLERGPTDLLPGRDAVESFLAGDLSFDLPHRALLLQPPGTAGSFVLALGGVTADEEALDTLQALVLLSARLEGVPGEAPEALDLLQALLPDLTDEGPDGAPPLGDEAA